MGVALFYILFGADDFSLREELEKIKAGLGDRDSLASNTTIFDGQRLGLNQLMDACMAMPFLGSYRLIIVDGLLGRFGGDAGEWVALKKRVADISPTTVLVLVEGEIKRDNALLKMLSPLASVKEFPVLKGAALGRWIEKRVKQEGSNISPQAVRLLASLVGENLWVLASEIEKLLLYTSGRRIGEGDVKAVVSYARETSVFAMVDALVEGKAPKAASLLHQLLQQGASAPYLIVMITRQLRMLVQAKELSQRGASMADIKGRLGLTSDYVLTKALEQSNRYSMKRLEQIYRRMLETDLSIKKGVWKGDIALDLLVAELCV
jgi:DNA polymerase-3 subunit delta